MLRGEIEYEPVFVDAVAINQSINQSNFIYVALNKNPKGIQSALQYDRNPSRK